MPRCTSKAKGFNGFSIRDVTRKHIYDIIRRKIIPKLMPYLCNWKVYVHDTHACAIHEKVSFILAKLNSYHPNIQFTFEIDKNKLITF